jgi:hypothetical protein
MIAALAAGKATLRWDIRWERRESALLLGAFVLMVAVLALLPTGVALLD